MIRKQIYVAERHQAYLARRAEEESVSEAEIIRDALDRVASASAVARGRRLGIAWSRALSVMRERTDAASSSQRRGEPARWTRDELYERGSGSTSDE